MTWSSLEGPLRSAVTWLMDLAAVPVLVYFTVINTSLLVIIVLAGLETRTQLHRRNADEGLVGDVLRPGCRSSSRRTTRRPGSSPR